MTSVGRCFAYRERAHTPGDPVQPVVVVKQGPNRSQKVRIRRLAGEYEGIEEWVPRVRLIAPWEETEALLEDERRMFAALDASDGVYGTVTYKAVETVYHAIPQEVGAEVFFGIKAIERELLSIDDLDAAAARLGFSSEELLAEPLSYVDRFGEYKAPFGAAVKVAKRCCERFSRTVLGFLEGEEDELRRELVTGAPDSPRARRPLTETHRKRAEVRLEELAPIFALVREWCGEDAAEEYDEVTGLREEVDRLRTLVEDTVGWLRRSGHPVKAALVRRELDGDQQRRLR